MIGLGGAEQRLGGNAAPVEAGAAEMLALDDHRVEPKLRSTVGGDIASPARRRSRQDRSSCQPYSRSITASSAQSKDADLKERREPGVQDPPLREQPRAAAARTW